MDYVESKSSSSEVRTYMDSYKIAVVRPRKHPRISIDIPGKGKQISYDLDKIEKGRKINLVALLSSSERDYLVNCKDEQVEVSTLKGNTVIIYCFRVPFFFPLGDYMYWALKYILSSLQNHKFKLVLVAKMSPGSGYDDFKVFLSCFPDSCLAIPISDSVSCDRVYDLINRDGAAAGLVIDPDEIVLQFSGCSFLKWFGSKSYPFTDDHLCRVQYEIDDLYFRRPVCLESLLGLKPYDCLRTADGDKEISVYELKGKLVLLYLCADGIQMQRINQAFQQCKTSGHELEIVVVHVALGKEPHGFVQSVAAALKNMEISSWWLRTFDETTSRLLWYRYSAHETDSIIIVGPNGQYMEHKRASLTLPYPYATEPLARQETERLIKLKMGSFLSKCFLASNASEQIHPTNLEGKPVIFFIGNCDDHHYNITLEQMEMWCRGNKGGYKDSNIRLVFVPLHASNKLDFVDPKMEWLVDPAMFWLICHPDCDRDAFIIKHLTLHGLQLYNPLMFVAFGEGGRIVSIAHPVLSSDYKAFFPFLERTADGNLPDQLYEDVLEAYENVLCDDDY